MNWKIRHEGSSSVVADLTLEQVIEGLQDGHWETTDEVQGADESAWVPLEAHPVFEEIAADVEPPPPHAHDDETNLDMNPLIDVCLVLLVFFILTTSYAAFMKRIEAPSVSGEKAKVAVLTNDGVGISGRAFFDTLPEFEVLDAFFDARETGFAKPHPEPYRRAAEGLGLDPGQIVFLDDTPACIEGAEAVGMVGVLVNPVVRAPAFARTRELLGLQP